MKKARFIKIILSVAVLMFLVVPQVAWADPSIPNTFDVNQLKTEGQKFSGTSTVGASGGIVGFFVNVIDLLVKIIGSLSLLVFIIGALLTIASEGKEDLLEKGKNAMLYAIIGLLVSLFSFIIVTFVQSILF